jgi:hypothetical protein
MGGMSKRTQRKRAPGVDRRRDDARTPFGREVVSSLDAPGLEAAHFGNMLRIVGSADTPLIDQVAHLRALLTDSPMLTVLAALADRAFMRGAGDYKEYLAPTAVSVEYPTWVYLVDGYHSLEGDLPPSKVAKIAAAADSCINAALWNELAFSGAGPRTAFDYVRFRTRSEQLLVRGPGYQDHLEHQLRGIFGNSGTDLIRIVGFDIDEALRLADAVRKVIDSRAKRLGADAEAAAFLAATRARPILGLGRSESPAEAGERVWTTGLLQAMTISAEDLAVASRLSADTCREYLECFSLRPGSMGGSGVLPGEQAPLLEAPLLALPDGSFFAHLINHLWWAAKPRLERALLVDPAARDRYTRARSRYLENRATALIAATSPHARAWQSLHYRFDAGAGEREYELDGLVLVDDVAFLIEAKAGSMSPAARRGAPSVVEDLRSLVADAHQQASRASRFVGSRDEAVFTAGGERVVVHGPTISQLFLVSSTLETLSAFVTRVATIEQAGVLPPGARPWSVCEFDLAVICDLVGGVGELVHYLGRRLAIEDLDIEANDELDWFGRYFSQGLTFGRGAGAGGLLLTQTTKFDDYYMAPPERRASLPRPRLALTPEIRDRVVALEATGLPGFVAAVGAILDQALPPRQHRGTHVGDQPRYR